MNNRLLSGALIVLIFSLAFLRGNALVVAFKRNAAEALIHKSFSLEQTDAVSRQRAMALAAIFLDQASNPSFSEPPSDDETAMIPAALRGLFYQRLSDQNGAAAWYHIAAQTAPRPDPQRQILISPWMQLNSTGDFVLAGESSAWQKRPDTDPRAVLKQTNEGTLVFSCSEVDKNEKKAALVWPESFDIPYHHSLVLHAKVEPGTRLGFETLVDGQLIRHLNQSGTGMWRDFPMMVDGDHVKVLYIIIREDTGTEEKSCQVEIDSITFLLDEQIKNDRAK